MTTNLPVTQSATTEPSQTPIEIALQIDENGMTTASKLYEFLELESKNFSRWCKRNIVNNKFATENDDYISFVIEEERYNPNPKIDYKITSDFAKKLSMTGNTEKHEQARQYFIACEQGLKVATQKLNSQSNKSSEVNEKIVDLLSSMNDRLDKLEKNQNTKKLPVNQYSRWKSRTFEKLNMLLSYVNENSTEKLSLSDVLHIVTNEFLDKYNIDLNEYTDMYKCEYGIDHKPYDLDVINHYKDIRKMYDTTLENIMKRLNIDLVYNNAPKNIFDVLASQKNQSNNPVDLKTNVTSIYTIP